MNSICCCCVLRCYCCAVERRTCQRKRSSPAGPALQEVGGSFWRSCTAQGAHGALRCTFAAARRNAPARAAQRRRATLPLRRLRLLPLPGALAAAVAACRATSTPQVTAPAGALVTAPQAELVSTTTLIGAAMAVQGPHGRHQSSPASCTDRPGRRRGAGPRRSQIRRRAPSPHLQLLADAFGRHDSRSACSTGYCCERRTFGAKGLGGGWPRRRDLRWRGLIGGAAGG